MIGAILGVSGDVNVAGCISRHGVGEIISVRRPVVASDQYLVPTWVILRDHNVVPCSDSIGRTTDEAISGGIDNHGGAIRGHKVIARSWSMISGNPRLGMGRAIWPKAYERQDHSGYGL